MNSSKRQGLLKICLDTNVWISAIIRGGRPAEIIEKREKGTVAIIISDEILTEIKKVLQYKKIAKLIAGTDLSFSTILNKIITITQMTDTGEKLSVIEDESDNRILECAIAGQVDFIISGDHHLLELRDIHGIPIITPREFLQLQYNDRAHQ